MAWAIVGTVAALVGIVANIVGYCAAMDRSVWAVWLMLGVDVCTVVSILALWWR